MTSEAPSSTVWEVESIAGVATVDPKPHLVLGEDGALTGSTGVNLIKGTYEAHNETLRIAGGGMTRRVGAPEAMDQERRFLRALEGWNAFYVHDDTLELGGPEAGMVCRLTTR